MRISDMLGQYHRNVNSGTEELRSAQSEGKMVSTLGELETGNIFEGTVNSVKNGRVTLSLSSGQMISARLDGKVSLTVGDSMFFQVRSNDGTTVSIKPYTTDSGISNPILLNALSQAGVPATERSVAMVDAMMREQMSIGKQSILDMVRVLNNNPGVKVSTLVQMTKIGLPVSLDMASQFENYMTDQHAILGEVEQAIGQLTAAIGNENLSAPGAFLLYSQILDILQQGETFSSGAENSGATSEAIAMGAESSGATSETIAMGAESSGATSETIAAATENAGEIEESVTQSAQTTSPTTGQGAVLEEIFQNVNANSYKEKTSGQAETQLPQENAVAEGRQRTEIGAPERQLAAPPQTLEQLLDGNQLENLKQLLQNIPTLAGNTELFAVSEQEEVFVNTMLEDEVGGKMAGQLVKETFVPAAEFHKNMTAAEFLNTVRDALAQNSQYGFAGVQRFFASREFQILFRNVVEQQWLLKPGELKEANKMNQLYERMGKQMSQMEQALNAAGIIENSFTSKASEVRNNIEFMNQINQLYTYVQIPLKMMGQNASGELYVYTNKKNLKDSDAELTAFLHLDLNNLGSTDVSVKMLRKNVKTNFYIEDDASYDLLEKHLPVLEKRLKNKGYTCNITVTNEKKHVDFVGDFLQKDLPPAGTLHRYSFDMKA